MILDSTFTMVTEGAYPRSRQYYAYVSFYLAKQIPDLVAALTENVFWYGGDISTARWEVSQEFVEYGFYQLLVVYELRT